MGGPPRVADGRLRAMNEPSLYDRLGGVFAISAVVDHFSDAIIRNAMVGEMSKNTDLMSGPRTTWTGCRGSSSCGHFGSATSPVVRSRSLPRSPEALPSGWRKLIVT